MRDFRICFFSYKSIVHYINGHHKQYIQVDIIFNYMFHFRLPGKCLYLSPQNTPFWRRAEPAPKRFISRTFLKTFSWKSKMKNVVKYCVYQDILLRVSICGTKCRFFKENPEMDPPVIRLREQSVPWGIRWHIILYPGAYDCDFNYSEPALATWSSTQLFTHSRPRTSHCFLQTCP